MKEFIETIVQHLVDQPDLVRLTEVQGAKTTVYELRVGPGDLGKVIGKKGQTAKSIRTLIAAISAKKGKRAVLEILE
ncbi:MAG: KH domain-containing protein [candidate division Zixibacteria bacterium]|nr:KH domain-containing protein [candidate division Zixibacteria bacterium]NIP42370.1 KH domain-containing protein [candidate division Zixibacteria bacterium]NIR64232.1 KH domain-containing protein [candidate division Zixibacteria bacterium]NIS15798.1 KH domain-containing protein [candidate division Zixibacteria bacterium]NIS46132.1 KH domain-containing protein [candidate division Zixibacteria bacterium]